MSGTPPDWTLKFDVRGKTEDDVHAILEAAAVELRQRGSQSARATFWPDATPDNARTLFVEGWRVRPDVESPLPVDTGESHVG